MSILKDIYKSIFGKDFSSVWHQFANENCGTIMPVPSNTVQFFYKGLIITFDAYTHYTTSGGNSYDAEFTRGYVEFVSKDDFSLFITKQGFIEKFKKLFGSQDIEIGERQFDEKFIVKSNDETKAILYLANTSITKLLVEMKTICLDITDGEGLWNEKPSLGNYMLYFIADGQVTEIKQLNQLFQLFTCSVDTLIKLNSIYHQ